MLVLVCDIWDRDVFRPKIEMFRGLSLNNRCFYFNALSVRWVGMGILEGVMGGSAASIAVL